MWKSSASTSQVLGHDAAQALDCTAFGNKVDHSGPEARRLFLLVLFYLHT